MLKKLIISFTLIFISVDACCQETTYGINAGYTNLNFKLTSDERNESDADSGFFLGVFGIVEFSNTFELKIGANYTRSEEISFANIPITGMVYIAQSNFYLQAGPQLSINLKNQKFRTFEDLGLDFGIGVGYQIDKHIVLDLKHNWELTNRYRLGVPEFNNEKLRANSLNLGLAYKFN